MTFNRTATANRVVRVTSESRHYIILFQCINIDPDKQMHQFIRAFFQNSSQFDHNNFEVVFEFLIHLTSNLKVLAIQSP